MIKKIKAIFKMRSFDKWFKMLIPCARYLKYIKTLPINENGIMLECQHGTGINGNIFYIIKELATNPDYKDYTLFVSCRGNSKKKIATALSNYGITNVTFVSVYSLPYMKAVATCKYLINDNTFLPFFTKREEQVYLNTWHGTPLKTLGRSIKNGTSTIGNTQKNFVFADYLLYPNRYTMEHMLEDYMLANISHNKCILAGYPRNTVFLDKSRAEALRSALEPSKKIYAYMPTWRGIIGVTNEEGDALLKACLEEWDKKLTDDEVLYVNLHPIAIKNLDFSAFTKIKQFPASYETYDFLNCADCLVTDYSSVFYDFAITGKKCVLFTYDEEEYFEDRGVYKPLSELPFPKVKTVDDLLCELRSPKSYDDTDFLKEYCSYDNINATRDILNYVFKNEKSDNIVVENTPDNKKPNVLLHGGNLDRNGVTTSLLNLLGSLDREKYNYYVCFPSIHEKKHYETVAALPDGVGYMPMHGPINLSIFKSLVWYAFLAICFLRKNYLNSNWITKLMKDEWKYEIRRLFGGARIDNAIQFTGYVPKVNIMFQEFDCNTSIYVHNDMVQEIETRGNQRRDLLEYLYPRYNNVALVTEDLWEPTSSFVKNTDNFKVVHNVIAYEEIIRRGEGEIIFEENVTRCNKELDELKAILDSDAKKFISVGRYSPEKGHKRMIDAFNKVWQDNKNTYFIIIGGNQRDGIYDNLTEYIKTLPCGENVILILSMANPLPIVKACDGFILGSFYEGFGLVIVEADVLGLPAVSTDITGPRLFMKNNNGTLVEDSEKGIEEGFRLLIDGKVPMLTTDYKKYNENAINEFLSLLK